MEDYARDGFDPAKDMVQTDSSQVVQKIQTVEIGLVERIGGRNLRGSGFAYGKNRFFPDRDLNIPNL
jgi:hypothetical protein